MPNSDHHCKFCGRTEYGCWQEWINSSRCFKCKNIKTYTLLPKDVWAKVCELYVGENLPVTLIAKYFKNNTETSITPMQIRQIIDLYNGVDEQPILIKLNAIN